MGTRLNNAYKWCSRCKRCVGQYQDTNLRRSHRRCSKKNSAKKFPSIHRISLVSESLYKKGACHQACNFIKKRLQQRCFPVNIANFLRTPIWKKTSEWLLLQPISLIQVKKSNSRTIHFLPLRATSRKALFVLKCFT